MIKSIPLNTLRRLMLITAVVSLSACGGGGDEPALSAAPPTSNVPNEPIIDLVQRQANKADLLKVVAGDFATGCQSNANGAIAVGGGPIIVNTGLVSGSNMTFDPINTTSSLFSLTRTHDNLQALIQIPVAGGSRYDLLVEPRSNGSVALGRGTNLITCNGQPTEFSNTDLFALFRRTAPSLPVTMTRCRDNLANVDLIPIVEINQNSVTLGTVTFNIPNQKTEILNIEENLTVIRQSGSYRYNVVANSFLISLALDDGNKLRSAFAKNSDNTQFISCKM
jgi:hypothetical protein